MTCQKMDLLANVVKGFQPVTIFVKKFILDV